MVSPNSTIIRAIFLICLILCLAQSSSTPQAQQMPPVPSASTLRNEGLSQNCTELYPRIFFTPNTFQTHQSNGLKTIGINYIVKFNTVAECGESFVTVRYNESIEGGGNREVIRKFNCSKDVEKLNFPPFLLNFVQRCSIQWKVSGQIDSFLYSIYGDSHKQLSKTSLNTQKQYRVSIPQPHKVTLVTAADWGPLSTRNYLPIYPAILDLITNRSSALHGLLIIGDIAYNLNSNNYTQYGKFMEELSQISPYLPIIPIEGNHESFTCDNEELFLKSFETFGVAGPDRVQKWQIYGVNVVGFNPYAEIYQQSTDQQYQRMRTALLSQLALNSTTPSPFTILTSHYPLICSQLDFHCRQTLKTLSPLYQEISRLHSVDLYLGAHMHQYERICPYVEGRFVEDNKSARVNRGMMVSVVEGVAGCDVGIIEEDYDVEGFSVRHGWGHTGFGVFEYEYESDLGIGKGVYRHYQTVKEGAGNRVEMYDEVTVSEENERQSPHSLRME